MMFIMTIKIARKKKKKKKSVTEETQEHKEAYAWPGSATDNFKGKTPATTTVLVIVFNTHIASNFILLKMK